MSYDDCRTKARLDNSLVIYNTNKQDLAINAAQKIAQNDREIKFHLTQMPVSTV